VPAPASHDSRSGCGAEGAREVADAIELRLTGVFYYLDVTLQVATQDVTLHTLYLAVSDIHDELLNEQ
jgi:hypothetical protein